MLWAHAVGVVVEWVGCVNCVSVSRSPHHIWGSHIVPVGVLHGGGCILAGSSLLFGVATRLGAAGHPEVLRHYLSCILLAEKIIIIRVSCCFLLVA